MQVRSLTLTSATLVSMNILIGAGLYINPRPLTQFAGEWSFLAYPVGILLLLPLIICLAELATAHPSSGGLYVYPKEYISGFAAFFSAWGYFLGKTASASLLTFTVMSYLGKVIPFLQSYSTLSLTIGTMYFLMIIHFLGATIGGKIQWLFVVMKAMPLLFIFATGLYFYKNPLAATKGLIETEGFLHTVPIAIFALVGFEVSCSIAHLFKNPEKNVRRVILFSTITTAAISTVFQYLIYHHLGDGLARSAAPFLSYTSVMLPSWPMVGPILNTIVYTSIISGAFTIITSNCWNLYKIGEYDHFPLGGLLTMKTKKGLPWMAILIQVTIGALILIISSSQVPLQNMAVFGMFIAYFVCSVAAYQSFKLEHYSWIYQWIAIASIVVCTGVLGLCVYRILISGISYSFLLMMLGGVVLKFVHSGIKVRD